MIWIVPGLARDELHWAWPQWGYIHPKIAKLQTHRPLRSTQTLSMTHTHIDQWDSHTHWLMRSTLHTHHIDQCDPSWSYQMMLENGQYLLGTSTSWHPQCLAHLMLHGTTVHLDQLHQQSMIQCCHQYWNWHGLVLLVNWEYGKLLCRMHLPVLSV